MGIQVTKGSRRLAVLAGVVAAGIALVPGVPASSAVGGSWAPAATATVHPGVQTYTGPEGESQCTANFVFTNGTDVFLGQAAHCAGLGEATDTDGCLAETRPLGTRVEVDGASRPGTLVYSSWITMQERGETNPDVCAFNDFALIRLDPVDVGRTNPSVPFWGGPMGLGDDTELGEDVYSYGNSGLRFGLSPLSPKAGKSLGMEGESRSHTVYTASPGIPGDSGSGFLDAEGRAIGILSTVAVTPLPASNAVSDLAFALSYLRTVPGMETVQLVDGTEPFVPLL